MRIEHVMHLTDLTLKLILSSSLAELRSTTSWVVEVVDMNARNS